MSFIIASCDSNDASTRSFNPETVENQQTDLSETSVEPEITTEPTPTVTEAPQISDIPDDTDQKLEEVAYEPMEVHFIDVGEANPGRIFDRARRTKILKQIQL